MPIRGGKHDIPTPLSTIGGTCIIGITLARGYAQYCQAASPSIASGSGGVPCPRRLLVVFVCLLAVGLCSWPLFLFLFVGLLPLLFLFGVSRWVEHLCILQSLLQIKVAWGSGSVQPRGAAFSIIMITKTENHIMTMTHYAYPAPRVRP